MYITETAQNQSAIRYRCTFTEILRNFFVSFLKWEIRTLEAQIDDKNKNIEARQNVAGSYKKRV